MTDKALAYKWSKKIKAYIERKTGKEVDVFIRFKKQKPVEFFGEPVEEKWQEEALKIFDGKV